MKRWWMVGLLVLLGGAGGGQQVITNPTMVWACAPVGPLQTTTPASCPNNVSSTITTTSTFQQIFAVANQSARTACMIQNNGTHTMYVFPGPTTLATTGTSVQLAAGAAFYCTNQSGATLQDNIALTGTSGDGFYASAQ